MMEDKKERIPEYLLKLMVLRLLDSQYPFFVVYGELQKPMEAIGCSSQELVRCLLI